MLIFIIWLTGTWAHVFTKLASVVG